MRKNFPLSAISSLRDVTRSSWKFASRLAIALVLIVGLASTGCKKAAEQPPADVDTETPDLDIQSGTKVESVDKTTSNESAETPKAETKKETQPEAKPPTKTEPTKTEPAKTKPAKTEPAKAEPKKEAPKKEAKKEEPKKESSSKTEPPKKKEG